jgi:hypothetical protein
MMDRLAMTEKAPVGVWLWLVLVIEVNASWIAMDVWLNTHGYEMLTTEFKEGLRHPIGGPLIAFATAGTVAAFLWHMLSAKT